MGKSKNKTRRKVTINPTGLPSVKEMEKIDDEVVSESDSGEHVADDESSLKSTLKSIAEKLQSRGVEDKECGCYSLETMVSRPEAVPLIMEMKLIRIAAPLMADNSAIVRHVTTSALRNLSASGDVVAVCEQMLEQDIMTPLVALLKKQYSNKWEPSEPVAGKIDTIKETFIEAVYLLMNLCECSNRAVKILVRENLLPVLLQALDVDIYRQDVTIAVASCIHTISEDNPQVIAILCETAHSESVDKLMKLASNDAKTTLIKVLAAGILVNMNCGQMSSCPSFQIHGIMKSLSDALLVDVVPLVAAVVPNLKSHTENENNTLESLETVITAQQVALEVLINICCGDDDGVDKWDDIGSSDASDEMMDVCEESEQETEVNFPLSVSTETHEAIVSHGFVEKILSKLSLPDDVTVDALQKSATGKKLLKKILSLQTRSFLSLNNLTTCLDVDELGGSEQLYKLWLTLAQLAFKQNEAGQAELIEATTVAMSGILKKLAEVHAKLFDQLSSADLQRICELVETAEDSRVRANGCRMLGNLGCLLGSAVGAQEAANNVKLIGTFLLEVSAKDVELCVQAEALDAIFDVFAEDDLDFIAIEIGLVDKLKHVVPIFKHKMSVRGRRNFGEHLPIIMTSKANLSRFIEYKMKSTQKCGNGTIRH